MLNEELEDWDSYVMNKGGRSHPLPSEGKIFCLANDKKETQLLLASDKKFMILLRWKMNIRSYFCCTIPYQN